jgi:aminoglycoside phosphotransferase (APT) family kinase protein
VPDVGPLLASGRDADVFACGHDLVVRRSRKGRSMEREAKVMSYLAGHGYPVPRVEDVRADGSELVMERIAGPTMLQGLSRQPWTLGDNAALLATLHRRLHEIPAPDWLPPFPGGGDGIVHLDLHPLNVILSPRGPVLIDWTNVARGAGPLDVALTWLVMTVAELPGIGLQAIVGRMVRTMFVRSFLARFDLTPVRTALPAVAAWKARDRNMRPAEVAAMQRLVTREASRR